jgi:tRNA threonylcarbamoyladenosine biosynthesis protein TsaE
MERILESVEAMHAYAAEFIAQLMPQKNTATIIALSGDLGAGKTSFTQGLARALCVDETVNSPTFVIEKIYTLKGQGWQRLIHIDAYRLESAHELEVLGWKEVAEDPDNLIVIEWPERVEGLLPPTATVLTFVWKSEETRGVLLGCCSSLRH